VQPAAVRSSAARFLVFQSASDCCPATMPVGVALACMLVELYPGVPAPNSAAYCGSLRYMIAPVCGPVDPLLGLTGVPLMIGSCVVDGAVFWPAIEPEKVLLTRCPAPGAYTPLGSM
jgi:hypothetical protein